MKDYPKLRKFIGTAIAILFLTISLSYITVSCTSSTVSNEAPDNAKALITTAKAKIKNQDFQGAENDANQALEIYSNYGDAYLIRGIARYYHGEKEQGIEDVKTAANIYNSKNRPDRYEVASKTLAEMQQSPAFTTPTESSSSDNSPSRTPETIVEQCSIDTSGILADLQNANRFVDEIQSQKALRFPVIQGKSIYSRISSDPKCQAEKEQLRFVLQTSWQRYLTASYNVGQLLSGSNKGVCNAGCSAFSDGSDTCRSRCDESYQSELERLSRERSIGDQEMRGFFGN